MENRHDRLRKARINAGFKGPTDASRHFGWNLNTYKSNENGKASYSYTAAVEYGQAFAVRPEWLYDGKLPIRDNENDAIMIVGKVGASATGYFIDDFAIGGGEPLTPSAIKGRIALRVEGDSMSPRFRPGEILIFGPKSDDPTPWVGREVMAHLTSGEKLVKVLRRGSKPGLWSLFSINTSYDVIEDQELNWVLPFEELRTF